MATATHPRPAAANTHATLEPLTRAVAALALAGNAAVHWWLLPEHLDAEHAEMGHAYIGVLFAISVPLLALLAVAVLLQPFRQLRGEAMWAGAFTTAAMLALLLASRLTNWMPAGYREGWEPLALLCGALEVVYLAAFAGWLTLHHHDHGIRWG